MKLNPFHDLHAFGAAGAAAATFIELIASGEASLLIAVSGFFLWSLGLSDEPNLIVIAVFLILSLIGVGSIYYFRPLTRKGALASGFAAIAVLAIFVP
ncbi:MAG: hypothetical protein AAFX54_13845 [Pseudomonadota bacterium]